LSFYRKAQEKAEARMFTYRLERFGIHDVGYRHHLQINAHRNRALSSSAVQEDTRKTIDLFVEDILGWDWEPEDLHDYLANIYPSALDIKKFGSAGVAAELLADIHRAYDRTIRNSVTTCSNGHSRTFGKRSPAICSTPKSSRLFGGGGDRSGWWRPSYGR
jgi:preprotein translocase subunit SecA